MYFLSALLMMTKETETTIETGELLHDIEQEATVVTCVEGLNAACVI